MGIDILLRLIVQICTKSLNADEIDAILEESGSEDGMEDFNEMVRTLGHVILDDVIEWCLDNPEFFAKYDGNYGAAIAMGLIILGIAIYAYEEIFLQNEDNP